MPYQGEHEALSTVAAGADWVKNQHQSAPKSEVAPPANKSEQDLVPQLKYALRGHLPL
jgi:hypothetical protein